MVLELAIVVPATDAYLNRPDGLAFALDGTLYVGAAGETVDHPSPFEAGTA